MIALEEFLFKNYTLLTHSVEATAAFTGVFFYKKYRNTQTRYFIYFLIYIIINEIIRTYTYYVHPGRPLEFLIGTIIEKNHWMTTFFWSMVSAMFFGFYYHRILENITFKKVIKYIGYAFFFFSMGYILVRWKAFFNTFFPVIKVSGGSFIIMCTVLYFFETLQSDKLLTFYRSINFYISIALFIWFLVITPMVFFDKYLAYDPFGYEPDWNYLRLRRMIYLSCNMFMYLTFSFALIWCKTEND